MNNINNAAYTIAVIIISIILSIQINNITPYNETRIEIIKPNIPYDVSSDNYYIILDTETVSIRDTCIPISKEMDVISKYIKKSNNRLSTFVSDKIAMAVSKKGARGLMQVLDESCNGKKINTALLYDIDYNIEIGIDILRSKLKISKGDLDKALFHYVGGDNNYPAKIYKIVSDYIYFKNIGVEN